MGIDLIFGIGIALISIVALIVIAGICLFAWIGSQINNEGELL